MKHKLLYILFGSVGILGLALGVYFLFVQLGKGETSEAISAIPIDAAIVVKASSIDQLSNELNEENSFWGAIGSFSLVKKANNFFEFASQQQASSSIFEQLVMNAEVFMSIHVVGKGVPEALFVTNIPERLKPADVENYIVTTAGNNFTLSEKEYNGSKIFTLNHKNNDEGPNYSFAIRHGVVIFSPSLLLVESSVGQLSSGMSLTKNNSFVNAYKTAGTRVNVNVFVNHAKLPVAFATQIHASKQNGFGWLANTGSWTELDLSVRDDAFYLNGFAQVPDSLNVFYKVFTNQKPVKNEVISILPAQTGAFVHLGISNFDVYLKSYRNFLTNKGRINTYNHKLTNFNQSLGTDATSLYSSVFGKQVALAFIPFEGETFDNCWFVVSEVQSQSLARQELTKAISNYAKSNNLSAASFERVFRVDRDKSVKIYKFPKAGLHSSIFGNLFAIANDQYFTFIDSYLVFGSSVESLSRLILTNIHNKQLDVEQSFVEFSQGLTSEANFTAYINPSRAEMLYGQLLAPNAAARILSRMEAIEKIQGIALQLSGGKGLVFNNITARYTPFSIDAPQTVWETRLDTTTAMKPQLVINHTTQNREIFVQDNKNIIYLINDVGRVLWKSPLQEPIMGDVHQVDIFRNGRLQFLFNTKTKLYLIDRNGNNVSGFPVTLRSPATNPVAVFDYDNNRNYRFFVAAEDRSIYVYNRQGNIVTGWDFDKSEKYVSQAIQHFRYGGKDYIVFADENRIYILDRRGNERVRVDRYFSKSPNSTISLDVSAGRPPQFVTTDTLGVVRQIALNGKVSDVLLKKVSRNHFFDSQDVDADGTNDFILLDKNELFVYRSNGKLLFSTKFNNNPIPQVIYFHFGARDRKLGVVCPETSQIYLINGNGELYKGFPLKGITPFSIGSFANTKSTFNLIVGSSSGYILNYAVQ
jgi:predicted XRE-type DNA-binding protein